MDVSLSVAEEITRTVTFDGVASGTYGLRAGSVNESVTVVEPKLDSIYSTLRTLDMITYLGVSAEVCR
jgi:hypothetical protein